MAGIVLTGRLLAASNATFLGVLDGRQVVYKPVAGERPLWDFPEGTLAAREVAAHLVSEALGWDIVPRTWLGDGPHGPGMLQVWVDEDGQSPVALVSPESVPDGVRVVLQARDEQGRPVVLVHEDSIALRRMAVFDVLVNNADRKGGHVLAIGERRHGVDHGVCFHTDPKLRTVLWGWIGAALTPEERTGVTAVLADAALSEALSELLHPDEVVAFRDRCRSLLDAGCLPAPSAAWPAIPWPAF